MYQTSARQRVCWRDAGRLFSGDRTHPTRQRHKFQPVWKSVWHKCFCITRERELRFREWSRVSTERSISKAYRVLS